jgi:hypothetical protein
MIAALRGSAERHGKLRTASFDRDYYAGLTGLERRSVEMRFGSWDAACRAAGFEPGKKWRTYTRKTAEDCVAAVREVAAVLGEMPSIGDYEAVRSVEPERGLPCSAIVRQRCGSWVAALTMAESG